jgi:putative Mg2+ transporter-C (MgtC) family protein
LLWVILSVINFSLHLIDITFVIKCLLSISIGFILGLEREYRAKPAGLKTYAMICLGATFFTHISLSFSSPADPSRIAAQIVSGLGFIGAGAIFQSKRVITGLTTASTLWVVGSLGTLVGIEMYLEAFFGLTVIYMYMFLSRIIQNKLVRYTKYTLEVILENKGALDAFLELFNKKKIPIIKQKWKENNMQFSLELTYIYKKSSHSLLIQEFNKLDHVKQIKI